MLLQAWDPDSRIARLYGKPAPYRPANSNSSKLLVKVLLEVQMEEKNGFGYFLLGLGLGVVAGVLLAPKSGEETREYLRSRAEESGDYLRARADDGREYLKKRGDDLRDSAADAIEKGKASATDILERSKSAVKTRRDNLSAAVEAGKQAYRDAVSSFESGEGV
jgi:gas vesicle protein